MTTDDIKQFAAEHYTGEEPLRIEWIDDTSVNIVYSSTETGVKAISAFTQASEEEDTSGSPSLRLRSAKLLSSHPESVLQVRSAVQTDRKKPRAYEASRFYLMHPEHDPREKLRREFDDRRRESSDGDYRRRRFDDRELRRRRDRDRDENFSANMYDDTVDRDVGYSDSERGRGRRRRPELFPDGGRSSGRLRNRSASPGRDTLDDDIQIQDTRRSFRHRSPRDNRANARKELFPGHSPNKPAASHLKKELFPGKASSHRRTDAIDAADETADLFSRRMSIPLVDGAGDERLQQNRDVELFPGESDSNGLNIRGSGQDQGAAMRGAANGISIKGRGASVRELFPSKYNGNAGKELLSDRIEGRGGRRRRAEDMFG